MSGECTVQRGRTWVSGERVDVAKLNQTGAPTVRIDPEAITATEIDTAAVATELAGVLSAVNLFRNPGLDYTLWMSGEDQTITAGTTLEHAIGWAVSPAGGDVTTARSTKVPTQAEGGRVAHSLEITGADAVTTVDVGQRIGATTSGPLTSDFTVSVWLYNATGASLTPLIRLGSPTSSINGFDAVTNLDSQSLDACPNQEWTRVDYTFDGSLLDLTKGALIEIRFPSGALDAAGKVVRLAQWQLTPAAASAVYVPPAPEPVLNRWDAPGPPGVTDDAESGFSVGSAWHYLGQLWMCLDPTVEAAQWRLLSLQLKHSLLLASIAASGTDGGAATAGSWEIETLGVILEDTAELANDAENPVILHSDGSFTLPAGLWQTDISVGRYAVNAFRCRLFDVTNNTVATYVDNTTAMYGTSAYANSTNLGYARSILRGRLLLTDNTKLRVETRVGTTKTVNGRGLASSLGTEIYATAQFTRLVL